MTTFSQVADPPSTVIPETGPLRSVDRWMRQALLDRLSGLRHGTLEIADDAGVARLGEPAADGLSARIDVLDARFYRRLAFGGSLGAAESYLAGEWRTDDLVDTVRLVARNLEALEAVNGPVSWLVRGAARLVHGLARNSRRGSRRNIAAHYDLGNDFFRLFLDPTMSYSAAVFEHAHATLDEAAVAKFDRVCRSLDLRPGDHLLEIGTGWGGLALHAAREYGCRVTTTTISREQHRYASQVVLEAGLADRVTLLLEDYRDLEGRFDKLVSIEMIEAVGHEYLDTYFGCCDRLLRPGGTLLVQAITMPEQRFDAYVRSVDFIQKYVFPGGCLPSVAAMQEAAGRGTRLRLLEQRDFGFDYARTLREWRHRLFSRVDEVREMGFDDRFLRLWDYYFSYCEAAFLERAVGVSHLSWTRAEY